MPPQLLRGSPWPQERASGRHKVEDDPLAITRQLERVLNLPPESLTKEIQLTQKLLDLFITYQIPSDLLSYDGDAAANGTAKVAPSRPLPPLGHATRCLPSPSLPS